MLRTTITTIISAILAEFAEVSCILFLNFLMLQQNFFQIPTWKEQFY